MTCPPTRFLPVIGIQLYGSRAVAVESLCKEHGLT